MVLDIYAELATSHAWVEERAGALGGRVRVRRAPVGVCVGVIPWNVPVFIAAVGGLFAFGATGIVLGPVILALGFALLEVWRRRVALHELVDGVNDASPWDRPN